MTHNPSIEQLLQQGELKTLVEQALKIHRVNEALQPLLPEAIRPEVQVSSLKSGTVVVDVANASLATLLRYQAPEFLSQLRLLPGLSGLASLKFRVAPPCPRPVETPQPPEIKEISPESAALLRSTAETLEDERLKAALLSLAGHVAR